MSHMKVIADPIWGSIPFTKIEGEVLSSPYFNRLHYIRQNGLAHYVAPSLQPSRFSHSIGVMHASSMIFFYSIQNSRDECIRQFIEKLYSEIEKIMKKLIELNFSRYGLAELIGLVNDIDREAIIEEFIYNKMLEIYEKMKRDPVLVNYINFKFLININYNEELKLGALLLIVQGIRLAGLLHDAGHLPMSHLTEQVISELCDEVKGLVDIYNENCNNILIQNNIYNKKICELCRNYNNIQPRPLHEYLSEAVIDSIFYYLTEKYARSISDIIMYDLLNEIVKEILLGENEFFKNIKEIVSDTIEADRMDYVQRESLFSGYSGVPFNAMRIIMFYSLICYNDEITFMPSVKSLNDIEKLLRNRIANRIFLINHHKTLRSERLLKKLIKFIILNNDLIQENIIEQCQEKYGININLDLALRFEKIITIFNNKFRRLAGYIISLTDDPWLLTRLRELYVCSKLIKDLHRNNLEDNNILFILNTIIELGEELFSGVSHYKSLWKREAQYYVFISKIFNKILEKIGQQNVRDDISKILLDILRSLDLNKKICLNLFIKILAQKSGVGKAICEDLENILNDYLREHNFKIIISCPGITRMISPGFSKNYKLWYLSGREVSTIELGSIEYINELEKTIDKIPVFYIYINRLPNDNELDIIIDKLADGFIQIFRKMISNLITINSNVKKTLNEQTKDYYCINIKTRSVES